MKAMCANPAPALGGAGGPPSATPRLQTILLATDLRDGCEDLVRLACALARDADARVLVLHVKPSLRPVIAYGRARVHLTHTEPDAEQLGERLRRLQASDPEVHLEHLLCEGDPATVILRLAEERGCAWIVLGLHGRTGMEHLLTGSVGDVVLRQARCPVVLVKTPRTACA